MTLHFTQIFFTDARTFIALLPFSAHLLTTRFVSSFQPSAFSSQPHPDQRTSTDKTES
jgi:hypothetical protein